MEKFAGRSCLNKKGQPWFAPSVSMLLFVTVKKVGCLVKTMLGGRNKLVFPNKKK